MKSRHLPSSAYILVALIVSAFLLGACGQTGELYMPETYSTGKPPPPPRESRIKKKTQPAAQKTASETEKTDERQ
ncbi:lipoprotein [Oxalobacter sp. OttesenSCG-928-P03]|nr:lipoprotein [Oxalobacter sp. OttesenSCG-928-P03]